MNQDFSMKAHIGKLVFLFVVSGMSDSLITYLRCCEVCSLTHSRIDYCNSLLCGLPAYSLWSSVIDSKCRSSAMWSMQIQPCNTGTWQQTVLAAKATTHYIQTVPFIWSSKCCTATCHHHSTKTTSITLLKLLPSLYWSYSSIFTWLPHYSNKSSTSLLPLPSWPFCCLWHYRSLHSLPSSPILVRNHRHISLFSVLV